MSIKYYPALKTTVSEMRALSNLDMKDFKRITPIFELTKSRKSKNNMGGDVYKKIEELVDLMKRKEFILDLTNEDSLLNQQINNFFDETNAFYNWTNFIHQIVSEYKANVIPMLLAYDDTEKDDLLLQAESLFEVCECISIRIPVELVGTTIARTLVEVASECERALVIVDLGYVRDLDMKRKLEDAQLLLEDIVRIDDSLQTIMLVSSYPSSVVSVVPPSEKMSSSFQIYSRKIYQYLLKFDSELQYGDYGCIHPYRYESKPMNWIPRIDYPYDNKVLFERCRREDGGYETCAKDIVANKNYHPNYIDCWGCDEIDQAALGLVNGKSPSYWISVRSNIHMTRMVREK